MNIGSVEFGRRPNVLHVGVRGRFSIHLRRELLMVSPRMTKINLGFIFYNERRHQK
jgi:hypothetical protein